MCFDWEEAHPPPTPSPSLWPNDHMVLWPPPIIFMFLLYSTPPNLQPLQFVGMYYIDTEYRYKNYNATIHIYNLTDVQLFLALSILSIPLCRFRLRRLLSDRLTTCRYLARRISKSVRLLPWILRLKKLMRSGVVLGSSVVI